MASQTAHDILTLSLNAPNRQPIQFLSLAPTTSASYPITPVIKSPSSTSTTTTSNTTTPIIPAETKERRSSSSASSAAGNGNGRRFLKLGPVHFGESYDCDGDWSEDVVAE